VRKIVTKKEFDLELKSGEEKFILFYSAYCPFCLMFLPNFKKIAARLPEAFLEVSTDSLPELEDAFAVKVVPTVLFFRNGKLADRLDGILGRGLTEESLGAFVKSCAAPGKELPPK
jgi:thioredoxin 1